MNEFRFENLEVYKKALIFVSLIYQISTKWPKNETYGLIDQLRRAAISIVLNIAEGSSRTKVDFKHFLSMARGSCFECVSVLTIARNLGYLTGNEFEDLYRDCLDLAKMLSSLKVSLK